MRVSFYLPVQYMPSAEKQLAWREGRAVTLEESGKIASAQCWIFQTWAFLQRGGFAAELVHEIPDEGIVVSLARCLPPGFRTPRGLFVADIVADGLPHPGAHVHLVQNALHARRLVGAVYMPHWPQPNIVPRDSRRGDTFERVAFFGDARNLAAELRDPLWQEQLRRETGANLEVRGADQWHDYHDIDAVLAIRDFHGGRQLHKPSTKLYNAWLAGVPFVGGADSAYASDGHAEEDYLMARSPAEVLSRLCSLRNDPALRARLVEKGKGTVRDFTPEAITDRWRKLLAEELPQRAAKRSRISAWQLRCDAWLRRVVCLLDRTFRD